MIVWRCITKPILLFILTLMMVLGVQAIYAQETDISRGQKTKVEVQLTESFYRALQAEGDKTYSTDKSDEYLRQIAVSTRFMVQTNLKVIENQLRIIQLLESMQKPKGK